VLGPDRQRRRNNARPETGRVYGAMDMPWATLVWQIARAYGK
jgi:hypothetical protein